mgnify:FL=1
MGIYLDYNASTPIAPQVVAAMRPFLTEHFGNPSSEHWAGRPARDALETARAQIASLLRCYPDEVVLTSGGSEANNQVIKGLLGGEETGTREVITTAIEHPAILEPCRVVAQHGVRVTTVGVDRDGVVDPDDIRRAITPQTALISVMHANNEVGTIQPITEIAKIAREHEVRLHTDAAQSVGKVSVRVDDLGVDLLSLAGHKLYAPKGIGALYVRRGVTLPSLVHGGGHEAGRRAGTESALLAVGLGAACALAETAPCTHGLFVLRERFWNELRSRFGGQVLLNGHESQRLPNTLSVSFPGHLGEEILTQLDGIAASTGSACHAGARTVSPVLTAMGLSVDVGLGTIRFSLGRGTRVSDINEVLRQLEEII